MSRIVTDINEAAIAAGEPSLVLERKTLHSIGRSYNIGKDGRYHKDDGTSSLIALAELKAKLSGPHCLQYQVQFDGYLIDEEGVKRPTAPIIPDPKKKMSANLPMARSFLVLAMPYQIKKLQQHGPTTTIGVDSTHLVSLYGHYLTTVMIQDEGQQGQVVAFCLSSNKDMATYTRFFSILRKCSGQIQCNYFMSDGDLTLYSSWMAVMGPALQARLCWWHVLRCWGRKSHELQFNEDETEILFKELRSLQSLDNRQT